MLQHTISQCFSWNAEDRFPFIPSWVTGLWQWFSDNSCLGSSSPKRTRSRGNSSVIAPMSSWLVCGSKASNHSLWFGGEEGADEPPSSQLVQEKACPRLALLQKGLWDASLQIKSLPPSIYISSFNLNRLSYSLGSSIHVCLDSSHGPHFFTVPEQLEDQTCPLTLAIAIGQCTKASQVVRSFLFPCIFSSLSLKKKKKSPSFEPVIKLVF